MKKKIKSNLCLLIPPVLTVIILLITYIIKGVYPFGNSNVSYYDMNQWLVPLYSRNYDVFHGSNSLIFEWFLGGGMDMTDAFQELSIHPINWIFYFLKPDYVLDFMALFIAIKLVLTSVFISLFLKKVYKLSLPVHITLSMIYTFSAYTLQYYICTTYMDSMVFLPLLMLAFKRMIDKGDGIPYMLAIFFQLLTQAYLGFMTLLYIMFYAFGYMFTLESRQKKKAFAAKVGVYTFSGIIISAITLFPAVSKWVGSNRVKDFGSTGALDIFKASSEDNIFLGEKQFMSFNTELAAALFFIILYRAIIQRKRNSPKLYFYIFMYVLMVIPMLNEGSLLLWHMGSYMHFPYRNAYMYVFSAIELISYLYEQNRRDQDEAIPIESQSSVISNKRNKTVALSFSAVFAVISIVLFVQMALTFVNYGIHEYRASYNNDWHVFWLGTVAFVLLMIFASRRTKEISFLTFSLIKITIASVCFIAPLKYSETRPFMFYTTRDKFIGDSIELRNNAGLENDYLSRVKLLYPALSKNYPVLLGVPSVNQWTNRAPSYYYDEICSLGYSNEYTSNLDCGGTVFSDAFLNNKKLIVYGDPYVPEQVYSKTNQVGEYSVYDIEYTLPFGLMTDSRLLEPVPHDDNTTYLDHQKDISNAFTENGEELFKEISPTEIIPDETESKYKYIYDVHFDSPSVVYAYIMNGNRYSAPDVYLNEEKLKVPFYDDLENDNSELAMNSTILVGCYDAGDDMTLSFTKAINEDAEEGDEAKIQFMMLDLDVMKKISERYESSCASSFSVSDNKLSITADVNGNNYMFLPLEYYDGWKAKVNGIDTEVIPVMNGAFMALKLPDGHCDIEMKYMPPSIIRGAIISLAGIIGFAFILILTRKGKDITETKVVSNAAYYIFSIVTVMALIIINLLPMII